MNSDYELNNNFSSNRSNTLLVIAFCILIAIPLLSMPFTLSSQGERMANENRLATKWPTLLDLRNSFTKAAYQINGYLEDHLVFRQRLLNFYAGLYFKIMQTGSGNEVVIGKDGWLYLADSNGLENARGIVPLAPQDAADWAAQASIIAETVNDYGGQFLIVIVPDKPQVYPEFLPDHIVYQRAGRRGDTLAQALENANLPYLELLDDLLQAKEEHASPIYSKTDTHWSFVGALSGYQTIINKLNSYGLELPIVERLQLRIVNVEDFSGDLARLLNLQDYFHEDLRLLGPYRDKSKFPRDKKLMLLGDSFAGNQLQFLEYSFIETNCVHHDWGKINLDVIREQKPDVVMLQMVERGLEYSMSIDADTWRPCGEGF